MSGKFNGKVIVISAMMDEAAYPWQADWYRKKVQAALGPAFNDRYRLYYVDNTMHTTQLAAPSDARPVATTRVVSYQGVLQQALRDLAAWCERDVPPPRSTDYRVVGSQIFVPAAAARRKGLQPVVTVTANGSARAEVKVGEPVAFDGLVEAPPDTGQIVEAEWDFEGGGDYPVRAEVRPGSRLKMRATHAFNTPGTYFPALRAASHRGGDRAYAKPLNIGRVRVVVT